MPIILIHIFNFFMHTIINVNFIIWLSAALEIILLIKKSTFISMTTFLIFFWTVPYLLILIWPLDGGKCLLQQVCSPFQGILSHFTITAEKYKECATKSGRKHNMSHNTVGQNRKHSHSRSKEMRMSCLHLIWTFLGRGFVHKTFKWSNAGLTLPLFSIKE